MGPDVRFSRRYYTCPRCRHRGTGHKVKQKAPLEFFLQPDDYLCPMTANKFRYWLDVLKEHFPYHPMLKVLGMSWYPGKKRPDHWQRLHVTMALGSAHRISFSVDSVAMGRLYVRVQKSPGEAKPLEGVAAFWLEPEIELYESYFGSFGYNPTELEEVATLLRTHEATIREAWQRYVEDVRAFQRESLALLDKAADVRPSLWQRLLSFVGRTAPHGNRP
jgi:hypothetical protein